MLVNNNSYKEALNNIISEINKSRAEAQRSVNSELIKLYWNIGTNLSENNDWGAKIIDSLSHDIRAEFPGIKGFSPRNLKYMQKFAREFSYDLCNSCCTIPWGHIVLLLNKTEMGREREWYLSDGRPEFAGKLGFYTSAIDGELKGEGDNPTIGLLLCKSKNNVVAKYSLNTISAPIGVSEYKVQDELPKEYENILPSPEDLITRI